MSDGMQFELAILDEMSCRETIASYLGNVVGYFNLLRRDQTGTEIHIVVAIIAPGAAVLLTDDVQLAWQ